MESVTTDTWMLVGFNLFVIAMLALDLGVFQREKHTIRVREALIWSAVWVSLALAFNGLVYVWKGKEAALQFLAGYLIEESLSVDNLFVFLLVFTYFKVESHVQHKVLFWGIIGAALMRATLILLGSALIARFDWVMYIFGIFLLITGIKLGLSGEDGEQVDPAANPVVKLVKKILPLTERYEGDRFFVRREGKLFATPLFLVLVVVETTDLVFALDSIPAIFAVTTDSFIVYTSNIFAILGLRSVYFALAGMMELFHYLRYGLAFILSFVGVKMLVEKLYHIPIGIALGVIALVLGLAVFASLRWPPKNKPESAEAAAGEGTGEGAREG